MQWMLLFALPTVAFVALDLLCGAAGRSSRWRLGGAWWERFRARRRSARARLDPFEALRVQSRLGAVADEIVRLERDPGVYAKAHRIRASALAARDHRVGQAAFGAGRPQRWWRSLRMRARSRRCAARTAGSRGWALRQRR